MLTPSRKVNIVVCLSVQLLFAVSVVEQRKCTRTCKKAFVTLIHIFKRTCYTGSEEVYEYTDSRPVKF